MKKIILASLCFALSQCALCMQAEYQRNYVESYLREKKTQMVSLIKLNTQLKDEDIRGFVERVSENDLLAQHARLAFLEDDALDIMQKLMATNICDGAAKIAHAAHNNKEFKDELCALIKSTTDVNLHEVACKKEREAAARALVELRLEIELRVQLYSDYVEKKEAALSEILTTCVRTKDVNSWRNNIIAEETAEQSNLEATKKKIDEYMLLSSIVDEYNAKLDRRKAWDYSKKENELFFELLRDQVANIKTMFAEIEKK